MRAYTSAPAVNNPDVAPAVPELARTYEQRAPMFGERNPNFKHGRGRARRWRREVDTRRGLEHRTAVLVERETFRGADGVTRTWRELMFTPLDGRAPFLLGLRARAGALMDQITAHGPASGWGVPQPVDGSERNSKWTPYEVPKASEKCWRWWRARRIELARTLRALGWLWGKPIPSHRTAPSGTSPERKAETISALPPGEPTRYRDHSGEQWAAVAERISARIGM